MEFSTKSSYTSRLAAFGSALLRPRLLAGVLVLPLLFAGVSHAANALIVYDGVPVGTELNITTNVNNALVAAGYTVTVANGLTGTPLVSGGSPLFKQVWDVRFQDSEALSGTDVTTYVNYIAAGGRVVVIGENESNFPNRNTSIGNLVTGAGGGSISVVNATPAFAAESVLPPFTTTPDAVTAITFNNAGGVHGPLPTGAAYINLDTSGDGVGTGIVWPVGTLTNGLAGILITVFDSDFMNTTLDTPSVYYLANLIGYMGSSAPYITLLTPNSGPVGTSVVITGGNFGATQSTSVVRFNGTIATGVTSWSTTSITASVPTGATTGNVTVTVGGVGSNGVLFTVTTSPAPPSVPTLSDGALILLACCLLAIGGWRMRRSHRPSAI